MMNNREDSPIITEITPLKVQDSFYMVDRQKETFDYPIHKHQEVEINFLEGCQGARRVVGDSIEQVGNYDLAIIGPGLEHTWEQYECRSHKIHEVTIQFSADLLSGTFMEKSQMQPVRQLLEQARSGIAFEVSAIMKVYSLMQDILHEQSGFYRFIKLLTILYELSVNDHYHLLASTAFAQSPVTADSRRVRRIEEYINQNYNREIRLNDLAALVEMAPTAFSRFFKQRTGRNVTDYILDMRIGHAARNLVNTSMTISEICYDCGFNNLSNFNRIFKNRKGCSPKDFRANYKKYKVIV